MKTKRLLKIFFIVTLIILTIGGIVWFNNKSKRDEAVKLPGIEQLPDTTDGWSKYIGTKPFYSCKRSEPYPLKPEFQRSLSLIFQRLHEQIDQESEELKKKGEAGTLQGEVLTYAKFNKNCIDIEYASSDFEVNGAEGVFLFSNKTSSMDRLKILVNPRYKAESDLLTSLLLSHELTHAEQFLMEEIYKETLSTCNKYSSKENCKLLDDNFGGMLQDGCFKKEIESRIVETRFFTKLNPGEISTLTSSYAYLRNSAPNQLTVSYIDNYSRYMSYCGSGNQSNPWSCVEEIISRDIKNNPFYQEQCNVSASKVRAIANELNALKSPEEKATLWKNYKEEGIITEDNSALIRKLLLNNK